MTFRDSTFVRLLVALNVLDAAFTYWFVSTGVAHEANPLMALLLGRSPLAFAFLKILTIDSVAVFLWLNRSKPGTRMILQFSFLLYFGIVGYHLGHL